MLGASACTVYSQFAHWRAPCLQVTLHPFDDGNGRLCRLLADHVLSAVFPFPIPALLDGSERRREVWLEALMNARDLSDPKLTRTRAPSDYAALLIECAWLSWRDAWPQLNRYMSFAGQTCMCGSVLSVPTMLWACLLLKLPRHCRRKELRRLRGKLFGNKFTHERYLTLDNINLSPEGQGHEKDTIRKCIQERQALIKHPKYTTEWFEVPLARGTHCLVYLWHGRSQI